jgi:hypothetical protein
MANINNPPKTKEGTILFPELSYKIMEAAFEVHNQLGPGFTEDIYEQAVKYELEVRNIPFESHRLSPWHLNQLWFRSSGVTTNCELIKNIRVTGRTLTGFVHSCHSC